MQRHERQPRTHHEDGQQHGAAPTVEGREPQPSANAIAQVFQALEKKGYLAHEPKGRGFVYRPIVDKQAYGRGRLTSVVNRFFSDSYMSVVSALIQEEKVTEADLLQYLADLKRREG